MKKYIGKIGLILLGVTTYGCGDYLEMEPLDKIVLENFWQEKSDLESVIASCYVNMCQEDLVHRAFVWGELRSDNIVNGKVIGETENDLLQANILPENTYANWSSFYNVINLCNTVIHYAPVVKKNDQNLTDDMMKAYLAEMLTLRSLCYFYLIRTFYEIPLVLDATIGDDVDFEVEASSSDEVLEQLVVDLLQAEQWARTIYSKETYNKGRITRTAVQALLADVYLWKGDYDQCALYCQKVIDAKKQEASEYTLGMLTDYNGFSLIPAAYLTDQSYAYWWNFGYGNSFESIFELQFAENQGASNTVPSTYFGSASDVYGPLSANPKLSEASSSSNTLFSLTDCRRRESVMSQTAGVCPICKYTTTSYMSTSGGDVYTYRSNDYANWIFYRLTDVMLMKAEALVLNSDTTSASMKEAFRLVSAVYNRANPGIGKDTLVYSKYGTKDKMEDLVYAERQRELLFEGKRWFDLVRMARRDGKNDRLLDAVIPKFTENQTAIRSKMTSPYSLYLPILTDELKVNKKLKQNPFYNNLGSTTTRN